MPIWLGPGLRRGDGGCNAKALIILPAVTILAAVIPT
jgi:hypothetical protein